MITESVAGQSGRKEDSGHLLSPEERAGCRQLAAGEPPHNQRAQALLALDQGLTQEEAGQQAGLTEGQVRYWLGRFRKARMAIFPETTPTPTAPQAEPAPAAAAETKVEQSMMGKTIQPEAVSSPASLEENKAAPKKKKGAQKMSKGKKSRKGAQDKTDKKSRKKKKDGPGKGGKKSRNKKKAPKKKSGKKKKGAKKKKRDKAKKKGK